jgi:FkbM family methyltransferase
MNATSPDLQLKELLPLDVESAIRYEQTLFDRLAGESSKSIVIFGAGNLGKKTLAGLRAVGIEPLAFSDNNSVLWNTTIDEVTVLAPVEAARRYGPDAVFVVAVWSPGADRRFDRIKEHLVNLGCAKVVSFLPLYWKYSELFLPHFRLDLPHRIYERRHDVERAFSLLSDDASRDEYVAQVKLFLSEDFCGLPYFAEDKQYAPRGLFQKSSDEVFVDCGAFDGDTIREFISDRGDSFGQMIAFEPDPANSHRLAEYVSTLPMDLRQKITIRQSAVGDTTGTVRFEPMGLVSSVRADGMLEVHCVRLDEAFGDSKVTYIKMDIEGAEPAALVGARCLIGRCNPILGICVYHLQDHLWSIPLLIHSLAPRHRLFLRRYGDEFGDVICYAVPENRRLG